MAWTKTNSTVGMAVCALIAALTLVITSRQTARLGAENERLQAEIAEAQKNAVERPAPAQVSAEELDRLKRDAADALRLGGEVASLRRAQADLTKLKDENLSLRGRLLAATDNGARTERLSPEQEAAKQAGIAKMNFTREWLIAFRMYAEKNQGQMPSDFTQARGFLSQEVSSTMDPNQFEIVY